MSWPRILLMQACGDSPPVAALRSLLTDSDCLRWQTVVQKVQLDSPIDLQIDLAGMDAAVLVLDLESGRSPRSLLQDLNAAGVPILTAAIGGKAADRLRLIEEGAEDFVSPPFTRCDLLPRIRLLLGRRQRENDLIERLKRRLGLRRLVGQSSAFIAQIKLIPPAANCDANVLISGETGTGKELVARGVHYLSGRRQHPFVPVTCGAVSAELAESELFGHEKGAFTGAVLRRDGLIREAQKGTLFLDDVDCLPASVQTKLLRFLQEKEYRRLGSSRVERADVRVIAASNCDLKREVQRGDFREDLFYRLNVIPLSMPPLRQRAEDAVLLARHFLAKYAARFHRPARDLSEDAARLLLLYDWPGNVRELENVIERAVVYCQHPVIRAADLKLPKQSAQTLRSFGDAKSRVVARFEKNYIQKMLRAHQGNITRAANAAQKNRRAFWELIRKHGIDVRQFKPATAISK